MESSLSSFFKNGNDGSSFDARDNPPNPHQLSALRVELRRHLALFRLGLLSVSLSGEALASLLVT
eukprot:1156779-Pelagomonas_calceolata.AAC.1